VVERSSQRGGIVLHNNLLLFLEAPHKRAMVVEYLILMIAVPIFPIQDVINKEIQQ
jgi:hypothetical protein